MGVRLGMAQCEIPAITMCQPEKRTHVEILGHWEGLLQCGGSLVYGSLASNAMAIVAISSNESTKSDMGQDK